MRLRERFAQAAPLLYQLAFGESAPPLCAILSADGRAGRYVPHGLEWVELVPPAQTDAAFALAKELANGRETFSVRDEDGTTLSGFLPRLGEGQIKIAFSTHRRYSARDFAETITEELFGYLEALVRIGEPIWILGDTGFEFDLGVALAPADHTLVVRPPADRPVPHRATALQHNASLQEALQACELGGFSTLVYSGDLDLQALEVIAHRSGVVFTQRGTSVERALRRAALLHKADSAQLLVSIGAVVTLGRSATGGAIVKELAEFHAGAESIEYTLFAQRGVGANAAELVATGTPAGLARIAAAGVVFTPQTLVAQSQEDVAVSEFDADDGRLDQAEDDDVETDVDVTVEEEDQPLFSEAEAIRRRRVEAARAARQADELHEDPGWELDAAAEQGLVAAPGDEGRSGMFRARPVVRPPMPAGRMMELEDASNEPELGKLTLDAPQRRKVMIPEAPSGMAQKRSFAEILKERHRFPPVSENGPTLSPPVLRNASGTFDEDLPDDEDITP